MAWASRAPSCCCRSPERGSQMTHVIIASDAAGFGVCYPVNGCRPWRCRRWRCSPATYVLDVDTPGAAGKVRRRWSCGRWCADADHGLHRLSRSGCGLGGGALCQAHGEAASEWVNHSHRRERREKNFTTENAESTEKRTLPQRTRRARRRDVHHREHGEHREEIFTAVNAESAEKRTSQRKTREKNFAVEKRTWREREVKHGDE